MLTKVPNPFHNPLLGRSPPTIHRIFIEMSGSPTNAKKALINAALVDWQVSVRKKKNVDEKKECPFYAPSTQNLDLRTFFGVLKDRYNFQYKQREFNKFEGSLGGVLMQLFQARVKEWGSLKKKYKIYIRKIFFIYFF